jgi:peroxiredoxin (alkyl hydroperoxide reductase subunit C)
VASAYEVFDAAAGRANRGTFLIDREGVIRFAEMLGPREPRDQKAWQRALADLP